MGQALPKELPDDWAEQVYGAFVDVQKWAIPVDAIALPWVWRAGWEAAVTVEVAAHTAALLFRAEVLFAMVDKPIALIRP